MNEVDEMTQIENHMVVGPDEFDEVVECKHEDWTHGENEVITNMEISFCIRCDACNEEGYVIYRPKAFAPTPPARLPTFAIEVVW